MSGVKKLLGRSKVQKCTANEGTERRESASPCPSRPMETIVPELVAVQDDLDWALDGLNDTTCASDPAKTADQLGRFDRCALVQKRPKFADSESEHSSDDRR
jgi:hypothetical protein